MDLSTVAQFVPIVLLVLLAICLVFGMLYGLGRGLKRSVIRLITVVIALLLAFLLAPFTCKLLYSLPVNVAGNTPSGWVEYLIEMLQSSEAVQNMRPMMPYVEEYVVGIVFALINMVLFWVLFFFAKWLSWVVYAILAPIIAPKKNKKTKEKYPRRRGLGLLVGLLQGLVFFFFFMIPIHGVININAQVANYQALGGTNVDDDAGSESVDEPADEGEVSPSSVVMWQVDGEGEGDERPTGLADDQDSTEDMNITSVTKTFDNALGVYKNVLRYTGMEFLSNKAFEYQITVRIDGQPKIRLSKDLVTALQLAVDLQEARKIYDRFDVALKAEDNNVVKALTALRPNDYVAMRYLVNKVFDLEVLNIGNAIIGDLDKICATSITGDQTVMVGAENWAGNKIQKNSYYAYLIENFADVENREQFAKGLRAMIKYVQTQKLNLVKQELLTDLNLMQDLFTMKVPYPDSDNSQPIAVALFNGSKAPRAYLDVLLTKFDQAGTRADGTAVVATDTVFDVIYGDILKMQIFQIITQPDAEKFITYSNFFDNMVSNTTNGPDLRNFLRTFIGSFMGKDAIGTEEARGSWLRLRDVFKTTASVVRDYLDIGKDFNRLMKDEGKTMPEALMSYLSGLIDETDTTNKYHKIDDLAGALHDLVFAFEPVTNFAREMLSTLKLGDFEQIFTELLTKDDVTTWQSSFRSIVNTAKTLNNPVVAEILSGEITDPKEVINKIVGTDDTTAAIKPDEAASIVHELLQVDGIAETVEEVIKGLDFDALTKDLTTEEKTAFEATFNDCMEKLTPGENETLKDIDVDTLTELFGDLWALLRDPTQSGGSGE